jgi:hypothetical protein
MMIMQLELGITVGVSMSPVSSTAQFGMSINVWRLAGDTLNTTCNFLCCNHQVHGDFLITLYVFALLLLVPWPTLLHENNSV